MSDGTLLPDGTTGLDSAAAADSAAVARAECPPAGVNQPQPLLKAFFHKLLEAQKAIHSVAKTSRNEHHRYNYASAEDIISASREALLGAGLVVTRHDWRIELTDATEEQRYGRQDGKPVQIAFDHVHITYRVLDSETGYYQQSTIQFPVVDQKGKGRDKEVATALTSACSYFLTGLLAIPRADEEMDKPRELSHRDIDPRTQSRGNSQRPGQHRGQQRPPQNQQQGQQRQAHSPPPPDAAATQAPAHGESKTLSVEDAGAIEKCLTELREALSKAHARFLYGELLKYGHLPKNPQALLVVQGEAKQLVAGLPDTHPDDPKLEGK